MDTTIGVVSNTFRHEFTNSFYEITVLATFVPSVQVNPLSIPHMTPRYTTISPHVCEWAIYYDWEVALRALNTTTKPLYTPSWVSYCFRFISKTKEKTKCPVSDDWISLVPDNLIHLIVIVPDCSWEDRIDYVSRFVERTCVTTWISKDIDLREFLDVYRLSHVSRFLKLYITRYYDLAPPCEVSLKLAVLSDARYVDMSVHTLLRLKPLIEFLVSRILQLTSRLESVFHDRLAWVYFLEKFKAFGCASFKKLIVITIVDGT